MFERFDFPDRAAAAQALAESVAGEIESAMQNAGVAAIAVSGGTTPGRFFSELGKRRDLDWKKVYVTLVDERWVEETSNRSNAGLVNETMLQGPATSAHFIPLYSGGTAPDEEALARTARGLVALPRNYAAVVLGMGNDGHTASFFPGGDHLREALATEGPVVSMHAPDAGEARVTQTLPRLLQTASLYLLIEG